MWTTFALVDCAVVRWVNAGSLSYFLTVRAAVLAVLLAVFFRVHPFLAVNNPVPADVLVVEGWVPAYALVDAWHYYQDGHYRLLLTTGSLCRTKVSASISENPAAPSPSSRTTWADGRASLAAIA